MAQAELNDFQLLFQHLAVVLSSLIHTQASRLASPVPHIADGDSRVRIKTVKIILQALPNRKLGIVQMVPPHFGQTWSP